MPLVNVRAQRTFCRLGTYAEFLKTNTWIAAVHQETDNEVRLLLSPPGFQTPVTLSVVFDPIKYTLAGAQVSRIPVMPIRAIEYKNNAADA